MPPRDGHERNGLRVVADLFDESRGLLHNFIEPVLAPLEQLLV